jgi:hypothetical protein
MALVGLKDDYTDDGRVLTEDLKIKPGRTGDKRFRPLAICYKQLNSSVGRFGTDMLIADTAALKTGSASDDSAYTSVAAKIKAIGIRRDALAAAIKKQLFNAEFDNRSIPNGSSDLSACSSLLRDADRLANRGS